MPYASGMLKDIRYSIRALRQNPGFAITAIVSIALAIGANSAIFSLADALVLRPLPVPDASRIVSIRSRTPRKDFSNVSYANYLDFRSKSRSFDGLVAYNIFPIGFAKDKETQAQFQMGFLVSDNFFQALGVSPQAGRGFRPDEGTVPGKDAVVVLSHDFWSKEFASNASVIGRNVRLNGLDFTVIGVMPEPFTGIHHILQPEFYIPASMAAALSASNEDLLTNRSRREFYVKGPLKRGVSIQAAGAEIASIAQALEEASPKENRGIGAAVRTEAEARSEFDPYDRQLVVLLFTLVVVVMSIACANVANLMLNRSQSRAREVAVRLAIGAGRRKIVQQLMTESLMIAVAGGALGLLIAQSAVDLFSRLEVPGDLPIRFNFQIDLRVLAFTLTTSVVSAVLFGLVPALGSSRTNLVSTLKSGEADFTRKRLFGRRALVVVQVAGSMVLLVLTIQMYRDIEKALTSSHGFRVDHRLTMRFAPALAGYTPERTEEFYRSLLERTRNLPGVASAALTASLPMTTNMGAATVTPEGYQFPTGQEGQLVLTDFVSDRYFETFAIPILAGRGFSDLDRAASPPVALVNEQFAKHFFNGNAVGKRLRIDGKGPWVEIVGMTVTGHHITALEPPTDFLYLPFSQHRQDRMTLIAETNGDPARMSVPLREVVYSIDPSVPVFAVRTMENLFEERSVKTSHLIIGVVGVLGSMGLALALVGLYAVVAYQVNRRIREIGIRMALGAARLQVIRMVLKQAVVMSATGIGIGVVLSVAVNRVLDASVNASPEPTRLTVEAVVAIAAGLLLTTLLAAAIPARSASRIDPQLALRQE
jgi:putative ABC transport system permease protein